MILHIQSQFFSGRNRVGAQHVLNPCRRQFPPISPAFALFMFYETTTGIQTKTVYSAAAAYDALTALCITDRADVQFMLQSKPTVTVFDLQPYSKMFDVGNLSVPNFMQ